jgi:hypothetical protein
MEPREFVTREKFCFMSDAIEQEHEENMGSTTPENHNLRELKCCRARLGAFSLGSFAAGAAAMGALAIGAMAVGALAIGRLAIGQARIRKLVIEELEIRERKEPHRGGATQGVDRQ